MDNMKLNFTGTHRPHEHSIMIPIPDHEPAPTEIIEEEYIPMRPGTAGSQAPDSPASPVLLPDLVAGWALTGGPQQTLDSTGVVGSGPLDLSITPDGTSPVGTVTFNSAGANFGNSSNAFLSVDCPHSLQSGSQPFYVHAIALIRANTVFGPNLVFFDETTPVAREIYGLGCGNPSQSQFFFQDIFNDSIQADSGADVLADNTPGTIEGFMQPGDIPDNSAISTAVNNGALVPVVGYLETDQFFTGKFSVGNEWGGSIHLADDYALKYLRVWIGPNALTIANNATYRTWLANVVGGVALGRTDAEVTAYTG